MISIIAAMTDNRVIGCRGRLPWHLPEDLRRFRRLTWGHPVIMGRKTFESIGKPLPGRRTIVLSRRREFRPEGCSVARSLAAALAIVSEKEEVFICGGAEVYREAMAVAGRIYLTLVHVDVAGEVFFPELPDWFEVKERREVDDDLPCEFLVLERAGITG